MGGYLVSFLIYTMAMVGLIFLALFVFKTFSNKCFSKKSSILNIEDSMSLSQRKTLYIIKANNEKFLIAADLDRTSLIAKLDDVTGEPIAIQRQDRSPELSALDGIDTLEEFASVIEFKKEKKQNELTNYQNSPKGPMMRELAKKLSAI